MLSSVAGASYTFSCNSSRGAVTVLGDTGRQQWYLRNRSFRQYIAKHHSSWYDFAVEKDHDVSPESLVLVSGWLKTSEWAIATFANQGKAHDISLNASAGSYASATFQISTGTEVQMSVEQRSGPPKKNGATKGASTSSAAESHLPHNQCLFLRYYKLKARALGRPKVSVRVDAKDVQSPWQETPSPSYYRTRSNVSSSIGDSSPSSRSWLGRWLGGAKRTTVLSLRPSLTGGSSAKSSLSQVEEMPQPEASVSVSLHNLDPQGSADSSAAS